MTGEVESWLAGDGPPAGERITLAPEVYDVTAARLPILMLHPAILSGRADGATPLHVDTVEPPSPDTGDDLDLPILQSVQHPGLRPLTPGLERLRLVNQVIGIRADVLQALDSFERDVHRALPEFTGRVRRLRADLEQALAGEQRPVEVAEHAWQEYNGDGNTCHYPGCRRTEDEHPAAAVAVAG